MKSPQFRCPHCRTVLQKCAADQVLGEAGGYLVVGEGVRLCGACGGKIDRREIVAGKYDVKGPGTPTLIALFIIAAIIIYYCHQC